MVGVVSSIPSGGNFIIADFETPRCQFCKKMPEMSDLCYLEKTSECIQTVNNKQLIHNYLQYNSRGCQFDAHWIFLF